jgi:uncharacterized membrane protein YoaK (UPF0700 family)
MGEQTSVLSTPDSKVASAHATAEAGKASTSKGVGLTLYGETLAWFSATALAFTGGGVDAIGLSTVQHYTTHMSGTTSQLAGAIVNSDTRLVLVCLVVMLAFFVGAIGSGCIIASAETGEPRRIASRALLLEGVLIAIGTLALLERHVGFVSEVIVLTPLAMAMGLQNRTSVFLAGGKARSTHVTGTLTDLGYHIGRLARVRSPTRRAKDKAAIRAMSALFCGFLIGGLTGRLGFLWAGIYVPLDVLP